MGGLAPLVLEQSFKICVVAEVGFCLECTPSFDTDVAGDHFIIFTTDCVIGETIHIGLLDSQPYNVVCCWLMSYHGEVS